ncbi:protein kinase [bacterium]|nr:protein kinase [bacterium]
MSNCSTCGEKLLPGALFCDGCGSSAAPVKVARKLRQGSFTTIKDAKDGLLSPGERLKGKRHYVIEEAIAKSGFGATFRASRVDDGKTVLIKQMLDQPSYDQFRKQLMQSFKREAIFLSKIKHPAFPRGYEYFERNKSFYLVMDFINGKELAKAITDYRTEKGNIEDGLVVYLGIQIADAIEVIHQHGYVYRDLKPQNVMLDGVSSRIKMIDFGTLYHRADPDPLLFESEGYTPPDLLDKTKPFLPAGDIYSLGALLYEAAMGETPVLGDVKPLMSSGRDKRLCEIIQKCLAVNPAERYQRARQVRDDLERLTGKGIWPFRTSNPIKPVEISILPKTLYPASCTFCEFCGYADQSSQVGYCPQCRVPLRVGRVELAAGKKAPSKEFFLNSDETVIGSAAGCDFPLPDKDGVLPKHLRIFRKNNGLWLEAMDSSNPAMSLNKRKIIGPVELQDGDEIQVSDLSLRFQIKDAC